MLQFSGSNHFSQGGQPTLVSKIRSWFNFRTIIILLVIVVIVIGAYYIYKSHTSKTSESTYRSNTTAGGNMNVPSNGKEAEIMLFYVDWCPHCKTAKPEWEQVKTEYENKTINGYHVVFTEVNCTNETPDVEKMIQNYKIDGYPTIKTLKDGQVVEFDAKPTKANLEQFLNTIL
jgi:thiol-disulfide isomerase/thioredoxin